MAARQLDTPDINKEQGVSEEQDASSSPESQWMEAKRRLEELCTNKQPKREVKAQWHTLLSLYLDQTGEPGQDEFNFPQWALKNLDQKTILQCLEVEFGEGSLGRFWSGRYISVTALAKHLNLQSPRLLALWFGADNSITPDAVAIQLLGKGILTHPPEHFIDHLYILMLRRYANRRRLDLGSRAARRTCTFALAPMADGRIRPAVSMINKQDLQSMLDGTDVGQRIPSPVLGEHPHVSPRPSVAQGAISGGGEQAPKEQADPTTHVPISPDSDSSLDDLDPATFTGLDEAAANDNGESQELSGPSQRVSPSAAVHVHVQVQAGAERTPPVRQMYPRAGAGPIQAITPSQRAKRAAPGSAEGQPAAKMLRTTRKSTSSVQVVGGGASDLLGVASQQSQLRQPPPTPSDVPSLGSPSQPQSSAPQPSASQVPMLQPSEPAVPTAEQPSPSILPLARHAIVLEEVRAVCARTNAAANATMNGDNTHSALSDFHAFCRATGIPTKDKTPLDSFIRACDGLPSPPHALNWALVFSAMLDESTLLSTLPEYLARTVKNVCVPKPSSCPTQGAIKTDPLSLIRDLFQHARTTIQLAITEATEAPHLFQTSATMSRQLLTWLQSDLLPLKARLLAAATEEKERVEVGFEKNESRKAICRNTLDLCEGDEGVMASMVEMSRATLAKIEEKEKAEDERRRVAESVEGMLTVLDVDGAVREVEARGREYREMAAGVRDEVGREVEGMIKLLWEFRGVES